jgi:hypothetical protein
MAVLQDPNLIKDHRSSRLLLTVLVLASVGVAKLELAGISRDTVELRDGGVVLGDVISIFRSGFAGA